MKKLKYKSSKTKMTVEKREVDILEQVKGFNGRGRARIKEEI